jgi:long-subunit fatty acid transport protein
MGMHIWGGDNDYVWQFRELDEKNVYTFSDSTSIDHIATEFSGFHFSFGMLMVVREHLRIGATILSPVSLRASETWDFSETFTWDSGEQEPGPSGNGEQRYRLRFPWVFRGGAAASFGPILLTGDAELVNHTQIQYTTDPPESKWNKTQANLAIKHNFKDRVNYRLGIETGLPVPGFKLRGGYAFIPSPWKIASAGEHRKVYSAGLGFAFMERFGADLAFAVTQWERPGYDVIENETFEAKNILLSFTYSL